MSRLMTIRHHAPVHKLKVCTTEATVVTTSHATEIFARVAPIASSTSRNQCPRQSQVIYESLAELLSQHGADLSHVVTERVFLRDVVRDWGDFQQVRAECYRRRGLTGRLLPAVTCLGQAPCRPGQDVELVLYAVVPDVRGGTRVESLDTDGQNSAVKLVHIGRSQHLYASSVVGHGLNGTEWGTIRQQSEQMWTNLLQILGNRGASPAHIVRASLYLSDIQRDLVDFRAAHDDFLHRQDLPSWPVLAIHGGHLHPSDALCGMDLHALLNPEVAQLAPMRRTVPQDIPACRSLVHGFKLALPEHTYLFVSATAEVPSQDVPAHEALAPSVERMVTEVRELLGSHGADFGDLAQVMTRLKSASLAQQYAALCVSLGLTDMPHSVVHAGLCRPELLAEMELTAIIATE